MSGCLIRGAALQAYLVESPDANGEEDFTGKGFSYLKAEAAQR